jgi:DNA-binding NarL/FixJ family response regulator
VARLLGASDVLQERAGARYWPETRAIAERTQKAVRADLSAEAYATAWTAGRALAVEDAVAEALAATAEPAASPARAGDGERHDAADEAVYPDRLTAREVEVLRLIAAGKSTRAIAEALVISPGTVERHVTNLYAKIGARGRADATAYAFRRGLAAPAGP